MSDRVNGSSCLHIIGLSLSRRALLAQHFHLFVFSHAIKSLVIYILQMSCSIGDGTKDTGSRKRFIENCVAECEEVKQGHQRKMAPEFNNDISGH